MRIRLFTALVFTAILLAGCGGEPASTTSAPEVDVETWYSACGNWISLNAKKVGRIQDIQASIRDAADEVCPMGYETSGPFQTINTSASPEVVLGIRCRSTSDQQVAEISKNLEPC